MSGVAVAWGNQSHPVHRPTAREPTVNATITKIISLLVGCMAMWCGRRACWSPRARAATAGRRVAVAASSRQPPLNHPMFTRTARFFITTSPPPRNEIHSVTRLLRRVQEAPWQYRAQ